MATYAFVGVSPDGTTTKGVRKAESRDALEIALFQEQLRDVEIAEKKSILQLELTPPKVKREEVMHLSRQLSAFIRAGLPLIDAVRTLGEEAKNSSVRTMMAEVETNLRAGEGLSDCFDRHPKVFPDFYRGILRSAELTGQLDTVLDRLAGYLERDIEAKRKIKAAMIYPGMIAGMSLLTVSVLAVFVLPKFKDFFASLDAELPFATQLLLDMTDFVTGYWWALLGGAVAFAVGLAVALRTERGRYALDSLVLKIPVLGETLQYSLVERFCRILASMVNAGVALPEAMRVSSDSLRNLVYIRALRGVETAMLEGRGLARPLAETKLFPSTAMQMMRVGEDTGTLDGQLEVAAEFYERELDYKIKRLTALFEPLVIIVMGGVVGFVAVALVSAMYGVFNSASV